jgi:hypothetical protein
MWPDFAEIGSLIDDAGAGDDHFRDIIVASIRFRRNRTTVDTSATNWFAPCSAIRRVRLLPFNCNRGLDAVNSRPALLDRHHDH